MKLLISTGETGVGGGCSHKSPRSQASIPLSWPVDGVLQTLLPESSGERGAKVALHVPATAFLTSITVLQTPTTHNSSGVMCF